MKNSRITHKTRKQGKDDHDPNINRIKELEIELSKKNQDLKHHEEKIVDLNHRIQEIMVDKREVSNELGKLQLMQIDLKLKDYQGLQEDYHKIKHRNQVTKNQLDKAREDIKMLEDVIIGLEKRGLVDYLLGRFPKSFKKYKKEK